MILSGKLEKGQKLLQDEVAQAFNASKLAVGIAFSRLHKDRLVITKRMVGTFAVWPLRIWIFMFFLRLISAYFLGKMVKMASSKEERLQLHSHSTSVCGFDGNTLSEPVF